MIDLGNNHTFQYGGLGTYTPDEFYYGSERITTFVKKVNAQVNHWKLSEPDKRIPEAEWGFDEALMSDILQCLVK